MPPLTKLLARLGSTSSPQGKACNYGVRTALIIALLAISIQPLNAAFDYNTVGEEILVDFDTLPDGSQGADLPWADNVTLPGWHGRLASGPATLIKVSDGSSGAGNTLMSFGTLGSSDKALGSRNSTEASIQLGYALTNRTGSPLLHVSLRYVLEQWYGNTAGMDGYAFSYSLDATSPGDNTATWHPVGALDASAPQTNLTAATQFDGNANANRTLIEYTFALETPWPSGQPLWLRWTDLNSSGIDHGIAIDDLAFSASTTSPAPSGAIEHQLWRLIGGSALSNLENHPDFIADNPTARTTVPFLESPRIDRETFGVRLRGWLHPDETGEHTFHLTADDSAALYLSTDENPENLVQIAEVTTATDFRDWASATVSVPISLIAGQRYYVELRHKQLDNANHASVGWTQPESGFSGPIAGTHLSPFTPKTTLRTERLQTLLDELDTSSGDTKAGYNATKQGYFYPLHGQVRTRESLHYAIALLDSGDAASLARAGGIIQSVIDEQDTDENSGTYGNWPKNMGIGDTNLEDANWAAFCGLSLAEILLEHGSRLDPTIRANAEDALLRATQFIRQRDLGNHPDYGFRYSNVAFLATATVALAQEYFPGNNELETFTNNRVIRLYDYTIERGGFPEFNSSTYMPVSLSALAKMRTYAPNSIHQNRFAELLNLAWLDVASNFHWPSMRWAGAAARAFEFQEPAATFLQHATDQHVFYGIDDYGTLPVHYVDTKDLPAWITEGAKARFTTDLNISANQGLRRQTFPSENGLAGDVDRLSFLGDAELQITHYQTGAYSLGSASRADFWSQRQGVLGFFGYAPHDVSYLRVRFLRDGQDFAAAQHFTAQDNGTIIGAIRVANDGGDSHPFSLVGSNFTASDIRLRFEIGGAAAATSWQAPANFDDTARILLGNVDILVTVPTAGFGASAPSWETATGSVSTLDLVLYEGSETSFDIETIGENLVHYLLEVVDSGASASTPASYTGGDSVLLESGTLQIALPSALSASVDELHTRVLSLDNYEGLPVLYGHATDTRETGTGPGSFTIRRTGATDHSLSFTYTLAGTASSADYQPPPASATFAPGEEEITIPISPLNDPFLEARETILLQLNGSSAFTIGEIEAMGIIDDDLTYPAVVHRTLAPNSNLPIDVHVRNPLDRPIQVDFIPETTSGDYTYKTSRRTDGPDFVWNDIAIPENEITGMSINLDTPVALPFHFPFYGQSFDTVYLNRRGGYISFVDQSVVVQPRPIPNKNNPAYSIFFLWATNWYQYLLTPPNPSAQFWAAEDSEGNFVIQHKLQYAPVGGHYYHAVAQTVLKPSGEILIYYKQIDPGAFRDFTVGLQATNDFSTMKGLEISHEPETPYLEDNFAIHIQPVSSLLTPGIWSLSLEARGTAGDSVIVPMTLDTTGLPSGLHTGSLEMSIDVPELAGSHLPVVLHVATDSYEAWKAEIFDPPQQTDPLVSDPAADPDLDGLSNDFERKLRTNPLTPNLRPLALDPGTGTLSHSRGQGSSDVILKTSTDLQTWTPHPDPPEQILDHGNGTETLTYPINLEEPRRFYRIELGP